MIRLYFYPVVERGFNSCINARSTSFAVYDTPHWARIQSYITYLFSSSWRWRHSISSKKNNSPVLPINPFLFFNRFGFSFRLLSFDFLLVVSHTRPSAIWWYSKHSFVAADGVIIANIDVLYADWRVNHRKTKPGSYSTYGRSQV